MSAPSREHELGILLVHGIGTQPSGGTIIQWGDVLLKTIGRATRERVVLTVERAGHDPASDDEDRAEAVVRLRHGQGGRTWLMAEGWWADSFLSPSYGELVSWGIRALPWATVLHVARRYWQATSRDQRLIMKVLAALVAVLQLTVAMALAPLVVALLVLMLILGLLPIPQLRGVILSVERVLTSTVGDSLAFVESPMRAALIRTRILSGLKHLTERCERTIVVAHSQGAAVVLDALGAFEPRATAEPLTENAVPASDLGPTTPVTLVTFGAGTNQLASLKVLSAGLPARIGINPVTAGVVALAVAIAAVTFLYRNLARGSTGWLDILAALGAIVGANVVVGLSMWATRRFLGRSTIPEEKRSRIQTWAAVVPFFAALLGIFILADLTRLPVMSVMVLLWAGIMLALCVSMILSRNLDTVLRMVHPPAAVERWVDLYASADPVSGGPTRTQDEQVPTAIEVWNSGSFATDHTTYWRNLDGFVLPVVRLCAETAGSSWRDELPPEQPLLSRRSEWRVGWLRLARWTLIASWIVIGVFQWPAVRAGLPAPFMPAWMPKGVADLERFALFAAVIALGAWATYLVVAALWGRWVRGEQKAVLAHGHPAGEELFYLVGMGLVIWIVLITAYVAVAHPELSWREVVADPGETFGVLSASLGFAFASVAALRKLRPAPKAGESQRGVAPVPAAS